MNQFGRVTSNWQQLYIRRTGELNAAQERIFELEEMVRRLVDEAITAREQKEKK